MISFKQYLTESRSAPLYHGTYNRSLEDILIDNEIDARTSHKHYMLASKKQRRHEDRGKYWGVSLSRLPKVARRFGDWIIELDQRKLSQNYKIVPFNWVDSELKTKNLTSVGARSYKGDGPNTQNKSEHEEFVFGSIKNLDRYITGIITVPENAKHVNDYVPGRFRHLVKFRKL